MKIKYETISINPPPLDKKILVTNHTLVFSVGARLEIMSSKHWTEESATDFLLGEGFDRWAEV